MAWTPAQVVMAGAAVVVFLCFVVAWIVTL